MKALLLTGLLGVLVLTGCLYDTALESRPVQDAEALFAGSWRQVGDKANTMLIRVFDEKQYVIVTVDGASVDTYRAFTSDWNGWQLANIQYLAPGEATDGKWAFFAYRLNEKGQLAVRMISDNVISADLKTAKQLRQVLEKNRDHPELFTKETVYEKVPMKKLSTTRPAQYQF